MPVFAVSVFAISGTVHAKVQQRQDDHFEQRQYDRQLLEEAQADKIEHLKAVITDLRTDIDRKQKQLDNRPVRIVTENLDQDTIDDALNRRDQAYRARDFAFRRLSEVRLHHHDTGNGWCRCKLRVDKCVIAQAVDGYRQLEAWESHQWKRKKQGLHHMLPSGHPGLINPRWSSDVSEGEMQLFD